MASTGEVWKLGHRPALDGLRGIAILLVIACHAYLPGMAAAGPVGVTMFFTLSGFLITSLLLEEHARGGVSLRGFYLRRARRLLPALVASTAAVGVASLWIGSWFFTWSDALVVALYVGNWGMVDGGLGGLGGTWSLAVEEQFYLAWPLVLLLCLRRSPVTAGVAAAVGTVAAVAWRAHLSASGATIERIYYGSETHADALLLGCLVAVILHLSRPRPAFRLLGGAAVTAATLVSFTSVSTVYELPALVVPPLTALGIYCLGRDRAASGGWLAWRPLAWVGQRSYGLYLWHLPVSLFMTLGYPWLPWSVRLPALLLIGVPLMLLSWRYVEQPFLRQRTRNQWIPASKPGELAPPLATNPICAGVMSPERLTPRAIGVHAMPSGETRKS